MYTMNKRVFLFFGQWCMAASIFKYQLEYSTVLIENLGT